MKIKFAHLAIVFASTAALLISCKEETACDKYWETEFNNSSLIIEVDVQNSSLSIQTSDMLTGGIQGEVYQSYFDGNFNVVAGFENFVAPPAVGTNGRPYVEMIMYNAMAPDTVLDTNVVIAGISSTEIFTLTGTKKNFKSKLSTATSGYFRIQRVGNSMMAQVVAGSDTSTVIRTLAFTPQRFAFRIGSVSDSAVVGTTAIKITEFNVSGTTDATLYSDDFTCNSIYP